MYVDLGVLSDVIGVIGDHSYYSDRMHIGGLIVVAAKSDTFIDYARDLHPLVLAGYLMRVNLEGWRNDRGKYIAITDKGFEAERDYMAAKAA